MFPLNRISRDEEKSIFIKLFSFSRKINFSTILRLILIRNISNKRKNLIETSILNSRALFAV